MPSAHALLDQEYAATASVLAEIRAATRTACLTAGYTEACTHDVVLAINEACMNVIQHAYAGESGHSLRVRLVEEDGLVTASILDHGRPADNADLRPREYADLRPGGLGVHFIRELTDTMAYLLPGDGWQNRLRLTRRLTAHRDTKAQGQ